MEQLSLFAEPKQERAEPKYPWLDVFPEWFPQVGKRAQIEDVILEPYGYVYMEKIRILSIEGEKVTAVVDYADLEYMAYANGQERILELKNLWPVVHEMND